MERIVRLNDGHTMPMVGFGTYQMARRIAQVGLRWLLQQGVDIIPKTTHRERMQENLDLFGFNLSEDDMQAISRLDTGRSQFGWW